MCIARRLCRTFEATWEPNRAEPFPIGRLAIRTGYEETVRVAPAWKRGEGDSEIRQRLEEGVDYFIGECLARVKRRAALRRGDRDCICN